MEHKGDVDLNKNEWGLRGSSFHINVLGNSASRKLEDVCFLTHEPELNSSWEPYLFTSYSTGWQFEIQTDKRGFFHNRLALSNLKKKSCYTKRVWQQTVFKQQTERLRARQCWRMCSSFSLVAMQIVWKLQLERNRNRTDCFCPDGERRIRSKVKVAEVSISRYGAQKPGQTYGLIKDFWLLHNSKQEVKWEMSFWHASLLEAVYQQVWTCQLRQCTTWLTMTTVNQQQQHVSTFLINPFWSVCRTL